MSLHTRRKPIDWTRGAGRARELLQAVEIIVPVYGAAQELERCLASVVQHTDLERHSLLIVVDGPQSADVEVVLSTATRGRIVRNEVRCGFVGAVNRGMRESTRDVLLLNSDTIVTDGWLEKMATALASNGDAATVTPLSNNATLTSVPRAFAENLLPAAHDAHSFATLVERVSARSYPLLPTAVGVCMLIRRRALDDLGLFDEERFGLGYGEENDFCFRALARGWLHLCDDATFIFHEGGRSFATERVLAQRKAARILGARHPRYDATIAAFMRQDPLQPVRQRIVAALRAPRAQPRPPTRVVHLVHGYPPFNSAGTEMYASWLVQSQRTHREVSVYARIEDRARRQGEAIELDDHGVRVRLVTNNFVQRNPIARNAIDDWSLARDFENFLREEEPDLVHIHHLSGHAFGLASIARRRLVPIVFQVQDWWQLCARVNLQDANGLRCSGPRPDKCVRCAPLTALPPRSLLNPILHAGRRLAARNALAVASAFVSGSEFIRNDYVRAAMVPPHVPWFVLPYGVPTPRRQDDRRPAGLPLRVGFIGSLLPHKGLHIAAEAIREFGPEVLQLRAWGKTTADPCYVQEVAKLAGSAALSFEGSFEESAKIGILDSLDVLVIPSIGLESFGLVAREAFARGVPVIASADGAFLELFGAEAAGVLFPPGDATALRRIFADLVADPSIVDRWRANIPPVKSLEEHAAEIEVVYERVITGNPR